MNHFILNTKIPCENCANSIKSLLSSIPGVEKVECSVEKCQIVIGASSKGNDDDFSLIKELCIDELTKSGRQIQ